MAETIAIIGAAASFTQLLSNAIGVTKGISIYCRMAILREESKSVASEFD
jgi:hypothetical protein